MVAARGGGCGETQGFWGWGMEKLYSDLTIGRHPKKARTKDCVWKRLRCQTGIEKDPAESSAFAARSILLLLYLAWVTDVCTHGNEVEKIHSDQSGKELAPLRDIKGMADERIEVSSP